MKLLGKSKDTAIDGLLRAYVSRSEALHRSCSEFDPDLANAYVEHSLPASSRSRYEQHISECSSCRKNVAALARLAVVDGVTAVRNELRPSLSGRIWQGVSSLSAPQWATAFAAVIVLAISVPFFLSRHEAHPDQDVSTPVVESSQPEPSVGDHIGTTPTTGPLHKTPAEGVATTQKEHEKRETDKAASNDAVAQQPPSVEAVSVTGADSVKAKAAQTADVQTKADRPASDVARGAGSAGGAEVAKNESDKKADQSSGKDSTRSSESKVASDSEQPAKEVASGEMPPPPAPAVRSTSESPRSRRGTKQPGKLGLRDSAAGDVATLPERKIGGKTFQLQDGVWTDRGFDSNKNMPVVNIVRDSNVYKELMVKQAGLKSYLDAFSENERAIIVYKSKVYKLIPQ